MSRSLLESLFVKFQIFYYEQNIQLFLYEGIAPHISLKTSEPLNRVIFQSFFGGLWKYFSKQKPAKSRQQKRH